MSQKIEDLAHPDPPDNLQNIDVAGEKDDWPEWAFDGEWENSERKCPICLEGDIFVKKEESEGGNTKRRELCSNQEYNCSYSYKS